MNPLYKNDTPGQFPPSWYAATSDISKERAPLDGDQPADVVILGAGFCGLWAAKTLAEAGLKPIVLEAHRVGFGASGRNGGQVSSVFNKGMGWLEKRLGKEAAKQLFAVSEDGKALVRDFCRDQAPDANFRPGVADACWTMGEVDDLREETEFLNTNYGMEFEFLEGDDFRQVVNSPNYVGGLIDNSAGHVHPLRYCLALAKSAEAAGAKIYEMTEVTRVIPGETVRFETATGTVTAKHGILAGNGYMPNLASKVAARTMPINSFIAATEPLGDLADQVLSRDIAVADSRFVVNYFRMSEDKRLLFGGRENYSLGFPAEIGSRLRERMETMFPQIEGVKVDYIWGGTLGITTHRLPCLARVGQNVLSAGGFSGHGVALSGISGKIMAEAILGQGGRFDVMEQLPTPAFPGGAGLRAPLLTLAMTWYALRDRLGI